MKHRHLLLSNDPAILSKTRNTKIDSTKYTKNTYTQKQQNFHCIQNQAEFSFSKLSNTTSFKIHAAFENAWQTCTN